MAQTTQFLVGTASWTDPTLLSTDLFYPPSLTTPEARLRFYAERFNTVEVDSTYYGMLSERTARTWVERTPNDFIFNLKAFALLTQHPTEVSRLPQVLRQMLAADVPARLSRPSPELRIKAFEMFRAAAQPLVESGKLGMILFQFPPYFVCNPANQDYLAALPQLMPAVDLAIEFRHPSWVTPAERRQQTLDFLRLHGLYYTSTDAPAGPSIAPSFVAASGSRIYMRFHGRNAQRWFQKGITPAQRFRYLYSEQELAQVAGNVRAVSGIARAYLIFNNCYANYGVMNAATMKEILTHPEPRP
ncbi:MAG TPA: DUF72 domain-containing protein [Candidatus Binataceae bacterium]|nr:DUF72 domain-containing protein [Candidatus Binataceae bacterium]